MTINVTGYKVLTMIATVEVLVQPDEDPQDVYVRINRRLFEDLDVSDDDIISFTGPIGYEERPATKNDLIFTPAMEHPKQ